MSVNSNLAKEISELSFDLTKELDGLADRAYELQQAARDLHDRTFRRFEDKSIQADVGVGHTNPVYKLERAKRLSAFEFQPLSKKMNWKKLRGLNIDKLVKETDTRSLSEMFNELAFADLESDSVYNLSEANLMKLVRVSQLSLQYLQHTLEQQYHIQQLLEEERAELVIALKQTPDLKLREVETDLVKLERGFEELGEADIDAMFMAVRAEERTGARDDLGGTKDQAIHMIQRSLERGVAIGRVEDPEGRDGGRDTRERSTHSGRPTSSASLGSWHVAGSPTASSHGSLNTSLAQGIAQSKHTSSNGAGGSDGAGGAGRGGADEAPPGGGGGGRGRSSASSAVASFVGSGGTDSLQGSLKSLVSSTAPSRFADHQSSVGGGTGPPSETGSRSSYAAQPSRFIDLQSAGETGGTSAGASGTGGGSRLRHASSVHRGGSGGVPVAVSAGSLDGSLRGSSSGGGSGAAATSQGGGNAGSLNSSMRSASAPPPLHGVPPSSAAQLGSLNASLRSASGSAASGGRPPLAGGGTQAAGQSSHDRSATGSVASSRGGAGVNDADPTFASGGGRVVGNQVDLQGSLRSAPSSQGGPVPRGAGGSAAGTSLQGSLRSTASRQDLANR